MASASVCTLIVLPSAKCARYAGCRHDQLEPVGHRLADRRQCFLDQLRHGEHGRAGIRPVAAEVELAGPAPGTGLGLHHGDLPASTEQVQRGGQAGQPGTDYDHVVSSVRDRAVASAAGGHVSGSCASR